MQLIPVTDQIGEKTFLEAPLFIYKDDPNFIRPLDKDIRDVFDKEKNKAFRHGECSRWILMDDNETCIGRIAAFVNKKYKNKRFNSFLIKLQ